MTSISGITKQYAGSLRKPMPQKGGAGGGVLGFLGMGGDTADDKKDNVADPDISADAPPAEPSLMDKALSAVGFGDKPEDAEATAATADEDAAAAKVKAEEEAAAAKVKAEEEAATSAPDNNVSMMDRITNVFKGDEKNDVTTTSAVSSDDGSDDGSDNGSDESSDDTEEDNDVDFEKYARKIQDLRNKYEKLKAEHKKLKEGKKNEPVEHNNSEFSKMIASLFAIKGSVAQLEYSMKKHAGHNNYPVEGLGLDDGSNDTNDTNNNEKQEKPSEIVSDSESESGIGSGSGSESEPEPEVPEVMSPPPAAAPDSEGTAPAPVGEIPEIPVNTTGEVPPPSAQEVPAPEAVSYTHLTLPTILRV